MTKNAHKPFIVKADKDYSVEVLGTSFNVSAYREDVEKSVVLVTGKVEVTASNGESVRILPNDRFRQSTDKYVVDKVNVEDYVSWKEGRLSFKNTELGGILKQLSRYYNVRIDYDKQQQITCSGKLNLDDTIEQILNTITETAPVIISKENNVYKVTIKRKIKDTPVLLLDDVLSELDSSRQNYLLDSISDIQTLITCTGLDDFISHQFQINKVFQVVQGTVSQPV